MLHICGMKKCLCSRHAISSLLSLTLIHEGDFSVKFSRGNFVPRIRSLNRHLKNPLFFAKKIVGRL